MRKIYKNEFIGSMGNVNTDKIFYDVSKESSYGHNFRASFFSRKDTLQYFKSENMNFNEIEFAKIQAIYIHILT